MTTKSVTSVIIDEIVKSVYLSALKPQGYRRAGRSFFKQSDDLFKIVNFQSLAWNTPSDADFVVNLHITLPFFHEIWAGAPFPKNPGSAANIVQVRLSHAVPSPRGIFWRITPETEPKPIIQEICDLLIEYGLPFVDKRASVGWVMDVVSGKTKIRETHAYGITYSPIVTHSILLAYLGRQKDAIDALIYAKNDSKRPWEGYDTIIERIAQIQPGAQTMTGR